MDFETAVDLAQSVERSHPHLIVAGYRLTSMERPVDSWALDLVDRATGKMITLDEKDDWERRLSELSAE